MSAPKNYIAVKLSATMIHNSKELPLNVRDISISGICFIYNLPLPAGSTRSLKLCVQLGPDQFSEPFMVTLKVMWATAMVGGVQIGGSFIDVSDEQKEALSGIIYLLSRDVATDENGKLSFRTGLMNAVNFDDLPDVDA